MNNLEQYIQKSRNSFNEGELPAGHKERFLAKIQAAKEQKKAEEIKTAPVYLAFKPVLKVLGSVAAVFILALCISLYTKEQPAQPIGDDYISLMNELENEIITLSKETDEQTGNEALSAMDNITFEAIPLAEQLPAELSEEQKARILREYYKQKTEGLKKIKSFLAQQSIEND